MSSGTRTPRAHRVRIIGGEWRSRLIGFPDEAGLRPTPDRVRETLFNWLGQDLTGRRCLDLFAGSGVLGFEALSRGASEVVMVEHSHPVSRALRENAARLGARGFRLVVGDALHFLATPGAGRFDVIFVDPPYASGLAAKVLPKLQGVLAPRGVVYVESDAPIGAEPTWRVRRRNRAGGVHYQLLEKGDEGDQGCLSGHV
ncbi:MAG TPA: 16S rRNA (guanine(966)-N(2))-methyltransferase RsmD [Burkholderiales bacterium]|nr:16S rRNA (guanine(966)-N(2))-methyltransferase RsmD [Burkholderiales bacterium]